jgi:uncharacterized caspase-like protein
MDVKAPSPQSTLLILLGASEWPFAPEFQGSEAFAKAAQRLRAYFLNPRPFGLPPENLLDLFNSNQSADELDVAISQFLGQRIAALRATGQPARDLLLYFIGHGGFVGRDSDFYLAIRRTRMDNPRASGLQMMSVADTLTERARHLRRIIILDCCFAAAAFSAFQSGPAQVALEKTVDAFEVRQKAVGVPTKGTTLLCSSNHKSPSLLLPDGSSTMFTKAFLDALIQGTPSPQDRLTLRDVKEIATDLLSEIRNAPKPVVHSPDQSEGDIADIPFFPNPKIEEELRRRAEEERRRQAEDERRRIEEERVRWAEEQARKIAEEEQARQAEKRRRHQAEEEERAHQAEANRRRQAEEERLHKTEEPLVAATSSPLAPVLSPVTAASASYVSQPEGPVQLPRGRGQRYVLTSLIAIGAGSLSGIEAIVTPTQQERFVNLIDPSAFFVFAAVCLIAGFIGGKLVVERIMGLLTGFIVTLTWTTYVISYFFTGEAYYTFSQKLDEFLYTGYPLKPSIFYSSYNVPGSYFFLQGPLYFLILIVIGGLLSLLTTWLATLKHPYYTQSK